ncbi:hypothetical protein PP175_28035 (plasmid) [Aneurinibacillus sp. Ricciae_BoGa-3]|uniref:hypothetical protein n=1 Tax=Aneurinibacillus sp. Ricciae_BoGa-3 TaxID=3022697 RepID=UPI0023403CAE|nr:hypothetical protein [Aneurinibacillus sp. Ricciae_BoGa-3]WCK57042.1 hypothetical protein PP175_28035 [Aneurinibacillus sp. Ricciae_BoGa-3]
MGVLVPFVLKEKGLNKAKYPTTVKHSMLNSSIMVTLKILPEELHTMLRILLQEQKEVHNQYQKAMRNHLPEEIAYWKPISRTISNMIVKFKQIHSFNVLLEEMTFIEMECLIGTMEKVLQQNYLTVCESGEAHSSLVTSLLEQTYLKILPIYEEQRLALNSM